MQNYGHFASSTFKNIPFNIIFFPKSANWTAGEKKMKNRSPNDRFFI